MNKLTAEKCRQFIVSMKSEQDRNQLSITGEYQLQALEIALPILEQREGQESIIAEHLKAVRDSLELTPHQDAVISCAIDRIKLLTARTLDLSESLIKQQEKGNNGWIEWGGNVIPAGVRGKQVQVSYSDGTTESAYSGLLNWGNGAGNLVIAYRVIENDGREG